MLQEVTHIEEFASTHDRSGGSPATLPAGALGDRRREYPCGPVPWAP